MRSKEEKELLNGGTVGLQDEKITKTKEEGKKSTKRILWLLGSWSLPKAL